MPEGDTIARAALRLRECLVDREITAARSTAPVPVATLVGDRVSAVEANGKHLLIRFASGRALHTHLRMTGSWRVYPAGSQRWGHARVVLEAGEHAAVCFNAPVVELLRPGGAAAHPAVAALGPDVLADPLDVTAVLARASLLPPGTEIGDVLLDQRVVAGIGNIWRSESLFAARTHPRQELASADLAAIVQAAARMMRASVQGAAGTWSVYRRAGEPCRRCGTTVVSARVGTHRRTAYWCPRCQPLAGPAAASKAGGPPAAARLPRNAPG